jgi:hypothetical protein
LFFSSSIESETDAANKLYEQWRNLSPNLTHVNKFSYEIDVSKYTPINQWSGITLFDSKNDKELMKIDRLSTDDILSFSSLIKSGKIDSNSIYYANYGRQEDFAYLFRNRIRFDKTQDKSILFLRRQSTIISQIEQIHQAIYYGFGGLVLFDDNENQQITTTNTRQSFFLEWARYRVAKGKK